MQDSDDVSNRQGNEPRPPYQDDFDTGDNRTDPIIDEETDDPTVALQIPANEFKDELDKYDFSGVDGGDDDRREELEDKDEDNPASNQ